MSNLMSASANMNATDRAAFKAEMDLACHQARLAGARAMQEAAAGWHNQRASETPDAFEQEFHEVSCAAIRAIDPASLEAKP
jgi:hypothetical protein